MTRLVVALLTIAPLSWASDRNVADWRNLETLSSGQTIEVVKAGGESLKGNFVRFTDESLTVSTRKGEFNLAKVDVARVRRHGHRSRNTWIGAGIGAAAGAGIGAGIGEGLSNTSGGDFANLKPAVAGATAVAGAAVGAVIGSMLSARHSDVYRAK